jgi:hypothetical protein
MQTTAIRQNKQKQWESDQLMLFMFLKIAVHLQTVFSAETHLVSGQWLEEQLNVLNCSE